MKTFFREPGLEHISPKLLLLGTEITKDLMKSQPNI